MTEIRPPWTPEQVKALNAYQRGRLMHPFTCPHRGDGNHNEELGDLGVLIAHADGWRCPSCGYTQGWAHAFMADPSLPVDVWGFFGRDR
jgi:hypothetical protein